jgi:thioredoxin-related protein
MAYYPTKSILSIMAVLLTLTLVADKPSLAKSGVQWYAYDEGIARGRSDGKKILINFFAEWCRYCKVMEAETYQDASVVAYLNKHFIPIKVNSDTEKQLANQYNVRGLPSTWFISETGERIANRPGLIPAPEMIRLLKYIGSDSYRRMSYQAFIETQGE